MQKKINYLARTFEDYRSELINFSNKYYPEMTDDFSDTSVGSWFVDLVSSVADNLSYHIDRMYQETNVNSAKLKSSVLNLARTNGLKVPGAKASMCEVRISCTIDIDPENISQPDWRYAPILKRSSVVTAGNYSFQLDEDVDFGQQFNSDGFSNRTYAPNRNSNGSITSYTVTKSVIVVNGTTRIYKKVIMDRDLSPFMEIVLPDTNVMNVESVICKETGSYNETPAMQEYYFDEEEYKLSAEDVSTFRFFEVESLADQYRFGTATNIDNTVIMDKYNPEIYDDYTETPAITPDERNVNYESQRTTRIYRGQWKPVTQKFITEYTDNGYMKLIFGAGVSYDEVPSGSTKYAEYRASKIINNDMLGVLPREGWTMYILYRVGGGIETNLAPNSINGFSLINVEFKNDVGLDSRKKGVVVNSFTVRNSSASVAGKNAPSTEEIKYLTKYNTSSQDRCVTVKDYQVKLMQMPPKYGAPFRSGVIEENNKIVMSFLGVKSNGRLTKYLPDRLVENVIEWMSHYKTINDYIEIKSGKIYNIGFLIDLFVDKNYNVSTVLTNVIEKIKDYMDINNHNMGDDIFVGDLEKEITLVDGVISLISLRVYNIYDGQYSSDKCPFPELVVTDNCNNNVSLEYRTPEGCNAFPIDLEAIDKVLYSDYDSMFEVLNDSDIELKVKLM
jgi:hypothetical protein